MTGIEILSDDELEMLRRQSGDDCDMAMVECVVRELRILREHVRALEDLVKEQQAYIKERRAKAKLTAHDFEPEVD